jgi:hypothetical protein
VLLTFTLFGTPGECSVKRSSSFSCFAKPRLKRGKADIYCLWSESRIGLFTADNEHEANVSRASQVPCQNYHESITCELIFQVFVQSVCPLCEGEVQERACLPYHKPGGGTDNESAPGSTGKAKYTRSQLSRYLFMNFPMNRSLIYLDP